MKNNSNDFTFDSILIMGYGFLSIVILIIWAGLSLNSNINDEGQTIPFCLLFSTPFILFILAGFFLTQRKWMRIITTLVFIYLITIFSAYLFCPWRSYNNPNIFAAIFYIFFAIIPLIYAVYLSYLTLLLRKYTKHPPVYEQNSEK
jgi:hypothetical protein